MVLATFGLNEDHKEVVVIHSSLIIQCQDHHQVDFRAADRSHESTEREQGLFSSIRAEPSKLAMRGFTLALAVRKGEST